MSASATTWKAGQSGNPGGRPKEMWHIAGIARRYGAKGIIRLAQLGGLVDGVAPAENEAVQAACIKEILDRGYGKAPQLLASDPEHPVTISFRWAPATEGAPIVERDPAAAPTMVVAWAEQPPTAPCTSAGTPPASPNGSDVAEPTPAGPSPPAALQTSNKPTGTNGHEDVIRAEAGDGAPQQDEPWDYRAPLDETGPEPVDWWSKPKPKGSKRRRK